MKVEKCHISLHHSSRQEIMSDCFQEVRVSVSLHLLDLIKAQNSLMERLICVKRVHKNGEMCF